MIELQRRILLFLVCICVSSYTNLYGQDSKSLANFKEPVDYRFYYSHSHVRDTSKRDSVYKEDMVLFTGKRSALFCSYAKLQEMKSFRDILDSNMEYTRGEKSLDLSGRPIVIPQEYLTFFDKEYFLVCDYYARHYWYMDTLSTPDWTIHSDTKSIHGLSCFRAEADIYGRHWEVWFTMDFVIPSGPWLLKGLPGLIVEAKDSTGEVSYVLTGYENTVAENKVLEAVKYMSQDDYSWIHVSAKKRRIQISKDEFMKLPAKAKAIGIARYDRMQSDALFEQGLLSNSDWGLSNSRSWSSTISNPIDLR